MNEQLIFRLASVSVGTRLRNREVLRRWQVRPQWALDFGCGVGVFCRDLMRKGVFPIGMDYDYQKAHLGHKTLKTPFFTGDIIQLPLKNESIPVALVRDVLEHLSDDTQALRELKRCLQLGGTLLITVPNHNWKVFYKLGRIKSEDHGHLRLYDKINLIKKITDLNFTIEKVDYLQNPLVTLFEFLLIKAEISMFGKENVRQSKMSHLTADRPILSMLYKLVSCLVWPFMIIAEYVFPKNSGSEILIIARKQ